MNIGERAREIRNYYKRKKDILFPANASLGRRAILAGAGIASISAAGLGVADAFGAFDGPRRRDVPVNPDNNPTVDAASVNDTLQKFVTPRLNMLLTNLGQLPFESDGSVMLPEHGVEINVSDGGQQVNINRNGIDPNTGSERLTNVSFIYQKDQKDSRNSVWSVSVSTTRDGNSNTWEDALLGINPASKDGYLTLQQGDIQSKPEEFTTNPTSAMPHALHKESVEAFKQNIIDALNFIDPRENATSETVDSKVSEWQEKLINLKSSSERTVIVPDPKNVTNGRPQIEIKAQGDENTSYNITYTLENGKIRGLVVRKNEKGEPFVENEYELRRDWNGKDWDMVRTRLEDGNGARGTGQHSASTNSSNVQKLTAAQFEAWSQNIDTIIAEVAAIK